MRRACVREIQSLSGSKPESTRKFIRSTRELDESNRRPLESRLKKIDKTVKFSGDRTAKMPSVGMRRTTRVFGVVKGVDSAGVLRSGRRLRQESGDNKRRRLSDGDDWFHHVTKKANNNYTINKKSQHSNNSFKSMENGLSRDSRIKQQLAPDQNKVKIETSKEHLDDGRKRFGNVYSRKRKSLGLVQEEAFDEKMNAVQFSRRQRRKNQESEKDLIPLHPSPVFFAVSEASSGSKLAYFLNSVLRYMRRVSFVVPQLASFLLSEAVSGAFASAGIRFLRECFTHATGICKFFGTCDLMPLFSVDFSAIPLCFMHMHLSLVSNFRPLLRIPVYNSLDVDTCHKFMTESKVDQSCISLRTEIFEAKNLVHEVDNFSNKALLHPAFRSKLAGRSNQHRNVLSSRGVQKRRSSVRRKRGRNPSILGVRKANGTLVSDLISSRKKGIPFSSVVSRNKFRSSVHGSFASNLKEVTSRGMDQVDMFCCSADVLVVESDKCFRIEGASVMLELSDSGEWIIVVKKNGSTRYTHLAQKMMRPSSANRITHDIIWTGDENWKLEFSKRQEWFIFKDLYKECFDRNVLASSSKVIPVPVVREVFDYEESRGVPFTRPDIYISLNMDEVARAMSKIAANYDMDSEDEEWLKNFNIDFLAEDGRLSEDKFELMIDAFEKALYRCPDDLADDEAALRFCGELGKREAVLAVYEYWMKRRKQKRRALLRAFQGQHSENAPLIQRSVMRKRRSFKRQSSQFGRGKQAGLLQVITERDALEEPSALLNIEQAKLAAERSVELAMRKRRRAQLHMQSADLAAYKATMALRIAEAASVMKSLEDLDVLD
ncbi:hypothetical protein K2173_024125 [Erythroxylum novogranatense]|uniref:Enhancer of polycomb-like protein n=1 Tax=Erythroxylum novogranatense TaxID=1862640 RepID=A0AAV8UFB3_9ROSI|nr:hypothetical protein K2173_024125 [Erythroxylum novogranatense]